MACNNLLSFSGVCMQLTLQSDSQSSQKCQRFSKSVLKDVKGTSDEKRLLQSAVWQSKSSWRETLCVMDIFTRTVSSFQQFGFVFYRTFGNGYIFCTTVMNDLLILLRKKVQKPSLGRCLFKRYSFAAEGSILVPKRYKSVTFEKVPPQ